MHRFITADLSAGANGCVNKILTFKPLEKYNTLNNSAVG